MSFRMDTNDNGIPDPAGKIPSLRGASDRLDVAGSRWSVRPYLFRIRIQNRVGFASSRTPEIA